ncbi:MAG TPA: hypothetical protein VFA15_06095, partial [Nitrososphaera sp.]|nr:hypothetical protein [Nitrososphaera sp.]
MLKDTDLESLKDYKYLVHVDLSNNPVGDKGTQYLVSPCLQSLNLNYTEVQTLEYVAGMKSLRELYVNWNKISDDSLKNIAALPELTALSLEGTQISDKGLEELKKIGTLESLSLKNSHISARAVSKLLAEMPALSVVLERDAIPCRINGWIAKCDQAERDGKHAEALFANEKCIEMIEKAQGKEAPLLPRYLARSAVLCTMLQRPADVKRLLQRAREIAKRRGNLHEYCFIQRVIRDSLAVEGKNEEALKLQIETSKIAKTIELPGSDPLIGDMIHTGNLLFALGRTAQARAALEQACAEALKYKRMRHYGTATYILAHLEMKENNPKAAQSYYLKSADTFE